MIINAPRWGRALRRVFNSPGSDALNLQPDVLPHFAVVDPGSGEQYWNRGENWFSGYLKQAAVVGNVSRFAAQAAAGSIATIDALVITSTGSGIIWGWSFGVVPAVSAQSFSLDGRNIPRKFWLPGTEIAGRRAILTGVDSAATPPGGTTLGGFELTAGPAAITLQFPFRIFLFTPGPEFGGGFNSLTFWISTSSTQTNQTLNVFYRGWERPYDASEVADWT